MPHDRNGNALEVGDTVRFDAKVQNLTPVDDYCNGSFEIAAPEENTAYRPQFSCNTSLCKVLAMIVFACSLFPGCAGKDAPFAEKQQAMATMLDGLRQSNFNGDIDLNLGGSPLGLNAATNWSLGPSQSTLHVRGEVDFTKAARAAETVVPPPRIP